MYEQLQTLLNMNKRILIYNGDLDMACNFLSDEWFIHSLNRTSKANRNPWYYGNNQVAGYMREYDGVIFATVKVRRLVNLGTQFKSFTGSWTFRAH